MKKLLVLFLMFTFENIFSQQSQTLKTEKITVIKSYSHEVISAQKENITPLREKISLKLKTDFNLFKFPNTYIHKPQKIEPLEIDFILNKKDSGDVNFIGNAFLGIANYWTIYGEFFIADSIDDRTSVGINAKYFSVNGKNKNSKYNMNFRDAFIKFFYNHYYDDYYMKNNINYEENEISYYGIPNYINQNLNTTLHPEDVDITNNFKSITLKNYISRYLKDTTALFFFNSTNLDFQYLEDSYYSDEFSFNLKTSARISIENMLLGADIFFENQYLTTLISDQIKNIHIGNFVLNPYLIYELEGFTLSLGANIYYNYNKSTNKNNIKVYPKFNLEYSPVSDIFTLFSTLEGGYKLNKLNDISKRNPWFSPLDLNVLPTDIIYDFSLGIKGNISQDIRYKSGISYSQINDNINFKPNINFSNSHKNKFPNIAYVLDNSFELFRQNTTLLELFFRADYKISSTKEIGFKTSFFIAQADSLKYFYQPNLDIEVYANLFFNEKWQLNIFAKYIGERNALKSIQENGITSLSNTVLNGFIDVNFNVNYTISEEFSLFTKINNVINQKYQIYNNYNSFGFWLMGGVNYKF